MEIEFDPQKRLLVLQTRSLDMADAGHVFDRPHLTVEDDRCDYGETRNLTVGYLVAWTQRGESLRIISMRKANEREQKAYRPRLEG